MKIVKIGLALNDRGNKYDSVMDAKSIRSKDISIEMTLRMAL